MERVAVSDAKHRILQELKTGGACTAGVLAAALRLTDVAVRQHLNVLAHAGLVRHRTQPPGGRGRPAELWTLTEVADRQFPQRYAELTVGLINAARETFGDGGLEKIVGTRADHQIEAYKKLMPPESASLSSKMDALARERTAEGYMAEVIPDSEGSFLLVEHHCPICEAARSCMGLCAAELRVFQEVLGEGVAVERIKHLLDGDERCAYRVSPTAGARQDEPGDHPKSGTEPQ
ncbi:MAG: helix-turn-helix transcriptional regulator [Phycisphaerae bacterium]